MSLFSKIRKNSSYRDTVINSLLSGIPKEHIKNLSQIILYVIDEKYSILEGKEFQGHFYDDEKDELSTLILPTIRRLYGKTFITPPSLFANNSGPIDQQRFRLFALYFDVDEFLDYLIIMISKSKGMLSHFDHIDKTSETLTLIVDNYIAGNVKKVRDCLDIESEIKKLERESKIKNIVND